MQGVITGTDVLKNLPLIWSSFGPRCTVRALGAILRGKKTTFLAIVAPSFHRA